MFRHDAFRSLQAAQHECLLLRDTPAGTCGGARGETDKTRSTIQLASLGSDSSQGTPEDSRA